MNHQETRALLDRIAALEARVADLEASAAPVEAAAGTGGLLPPRKPVGRPPKNGQANA